ncbi:protein chain initiation factor 2 [Salmonella enterica subsp. enterica]|uniref:Protein chain initiation factor 2 n=1 Tax=Salmonella enterica I TaxID=59201 RepID=A0A447PXE6_SALET|nr:protein chain initiation factor 2 [Salmonella enterica subsp. enterica]VEA43721.1 protein chain initiation factor 2 [Salmonella enterica subsp. enterica]
MTDVTLKALAAERQVSVDRLVQQFADAGIRKSADDSVSAQEKQTLLAHLNREAVSGPDKLTLQRKTRSTLNIPGTGGKSKSVQIEVRKKRTFVKRDPQELNAWPRKSRRSVKRKSKPVVRQKNRPNARRNKKLNARPQNKLSVKPLKKRNVKLRKKTK